MRQARKTDVPGMVLLAVGAMLALVTFFTAMLSIWQGAASDGVVQFGIRALAVYALVGAAVALFVTIRRGRTRRHYGA
ncbi:hypothetical protein NUH88_07890 [Nisaea acidiphila]|uniref:Uncharacterized protein n=1 Tax=Nisaea acidiphila TaxID=1862145 RepID=A0A9J7AWC9_9PROT|nr:hypothetical protein [Nisaea acidiphila]UUX51608.1 hypothetical protein NUH88_07890 [Nisaea acidiphila]